MIHPEIYTSDSGLSQSDLKAFKTNRLAFYNDKILKLANPYDKKSSKSMKIGDITDMLVLTPEDEKDWVFLPQVDCSESVQKIMDNSMFRIRKAWSEFEQTVDIDNDEQSESMKTKFIHWDTVIDTMVEEARIQKYQSSYGDDALKKALEKTGRKYYESKMMYDGKVVSSVENKAVADKCKNKLYSDPITKRLFLDLPDYAKAYAQGMFFGEFESIRQKILIDYYIVNEKLKIISPFDLKTAQSHQRFMINYYQFYYGKQGSFYHNVLSQNFPGYKVLPFSFIVVTTSDDDAPILYRMSDNEIKLYAEGGTTSRGVKVEGWQKTMKDIRWHIDNDSWAYPRAYTENNSVIILDSQNDIIEGDTSGDDDDVL